MARTVYQRLYEGQDLCIYIGKLKRSFLFQMLYMYFFSISDALHIHINYKHMNVLFPQKKRNEVPLVRNSHHDLWQKLNCAAGVTQQVSNHPFATCLRFSANPIHCLRSKFASWPQRNLCQFVKIRHFAKGFVYRSGGMEVCKCCRL